MALDRVSIGMIEPHLTGARILCLGYPDMPGGAPSAVAWLASKGASDVDVVDIIAHRGFERIVDLNVPQTWPRRYSLVINPGTLEHCFNLGQAWANAWAALDVGGVLMQIAPVTMLNHGFWNINPIACQDWCEANGGKVIALRFGTNGTAAEVTPHRISESNSGRGALPQETVMYALMRKEQDIEPKWPAQGVYRR